MEQQTLPSSRNKDGAAPRSKRAIFPSFFFSRSAVGGVLNILPNCPRLYHLFLTLSDPVTYLIGFRLSTGWGTDIAIRSQFLIN